MVKNKNTNALEELQERNKELEDSISDSLDCDIYI